LTKENNDVGSKSTTMRGGITLAKVLHNLIDDSEDAKLRLKVIFPVINNIPQIGLTCIKKDSNDSHRFAVGEIMIKKLLTRFGMHCEILAFLIDHLLDEMKLLIL
jgi:hypothetical protein